MRSVGCCCPIVLLGMVGAVVVGAVAVAVVAARAGRTGSRGDADR